jgi:coenzyme F420-0:L-glutamate ligase/coenzyme F420-1:gamma-L-glutamate ligase
VSRLEIFGIEGVPVVTPGDDLAGLLAAACNESGTALRDGDVVVVASKVVAKAEGKLEAVDPTDPLSHKPLVERESIRILRRRGDLIISETKHGFVCANAGIDRSNIADGWVVLLPDDPDRSARRLRDGIRARAGVEVAVIVSDTFGRTWRRGLTDVALGCAGIGAVLDLRGTTDTYGHELEVTVVAIVDEIAGAAELVMGQATDTCAAVVRGVDPSWLRTGSVKDEILRTPQEDLFR